VVLPLGQDGNVVFVAVREEGVPEQPFFDLIAEIHLARELVCANAVEGSQIKQGV